MCDVIGKLAEYAHLVPEEHKFYMDNIDRYGFSLEGLKILRDHPLVPLELRFELTDFICAVCFHPINK